MSVANGREFLHIPGPTTIPDAVLAAMHRPAIDIYSGDMLGLTHSLHDDLPKVFRTAGRVYIYAANGHGGWEAALSNVLSRGDTVLVLESGIFAAGWGEMAQMMGVKVESLKGDPRRAVNPDAVRQRLEADASHEIKAVLVVQIDTASGVANDLPAIRAAMDAARHPALLMVDAVASLGCMPFEMDAWRIDVTMSGSQKGLMTPPGLAFVAANERAHAAHQKADLRTRYWDWTFRQGQAHYQKYGGTPPQHLLFGLRKALDLLLAEGLEHAARRHALLAEATRQAVGPVGGGRRARLERHPSRGARQLHHLRAHAGPRSAAPPRLLPQPVRCRPRRRHRPVLGQGLPHRPHGPYQRAHGARRARRGGDGADRAPHSPRSRRRAAGHRVPRPRGRRLADKKRSC